MEKSYKMQQIYIYIYVCIPYLARNNTFDFYPFEFANEPLIESLVRELL